MIAKALVLRTSGTNCDAETLHALKIAGAKTELLHLREILQNPDKIFGFSLLVIPGGFSYGDDISAGKIFANEIKHKLGNIIQKFVKEHKLIIGICNGFQVLVKTGLLPGLNGKPFKQTVTLAKNCSGRFQCEWVQLKREKSKARWLKSLPINFELPIAHGEGRFVAQNNKILNTIEKNGQVILRYFKRNPNGSVRAIAGICNAEGNVIGMMPHPERFVSEYQHPAWTREHFSGDAPGFIFWKSVVRYAEELG